MGTASVLQGEVRVLGKVVKDSVPAGVGYVPQLETVDWNFPVTVEQVVMMGRTREMGIWPWPTR